MAFLTKICKTIPLLFLWGCAPYKVPTTEVASPATIDAHLYKIIPRHRCQIEWYDFGHWTTWTLFGNDDGGIFGEDDPSPYCPEYPYGGGKAVSWWLRNPLHNFCYYVIGNATRNNSELALLALSPKGIEFFRYTPAGYRVFAHRKGGLLIALHGGKPLISLKIPYGPAYRGEFYIGWRYRGNFGIKFRPWTRNKGSDKISSKKKGFNGSGSF